MSGPRELDNQGMATVLLLLLTPAFFALAGLVLDGGRQLAARQHTASLAEQAARAGADQLDTATLRGSGTAHLDAEQATRAACRYVVTVEPAARCTATVQNGLEGEQVQVRVAIQSRTVLLGLLGINTFDTDALGTAQPVTGIRTRLPSSGAQP